MCCRFLASLLRAKRFILVFPCPAMDRGFLLAVCFSVLVTGVLSQQGTSILSIIPDNSQTSWTLRDFPGVNGNLSPPSFMLAGPVAITVNQVDQSTGQPKVIELGAAPWP